MRILEIVLEGFKSYATRTIISDFDEHFNAISGFNGSGKSNILDAICFVLGITSLDKVRITNRQEFIYKNGQAGVTKANVTILFDNSDKSRCHEAYKKYDTISVRREYSVGGVSKCTIQGTTVTNEKVLQLFTMSGLNVNNASFLVFQGKITRVINMKPTEILSLVEETAGTNAYEEIKKKTLRLIEKKDSKLQEIDNILNSEVMPLMQQLVKENEDYLKWRELCGEIEGLERKVKAFTYYEIREKLINAEEVRKNYEENSREMEKKKKHLENQIKELEKKMKENKDKESKLIPEEDKKRFESLKGEKTKIEAQMNRNKNELVDWENQKNECLHQIEKNKQVSIRKSANLQRAAEDMEKLKETNSEIKKNLENFKNKLLAIERGAEMNENFTEERILELERKRENLQQEILTKETMANSMQKRLQARRKELSNAQSVETFDFSALNAQITSLEHQISQVSFPSEEDVSLLESEKLTLENEISKISRNLERIDQNKFTLNYNLPEANFDRSRIKGRVISLIRLKEEKYARALESFAGGRLSSIVVDTDVTGQLLLKKKTFGNVSILPNNKTLPNVVPQNIKNQIETMFGNKAKLALDLIDFNHENYNSIGFVFGNFFVCESKEIAEKIAYDKRFSRIAVTLEGDIYNPSGTISGGESLSRASVLAEFYQYQAQEKHLEKLHKKMSEIAKRLHDFERLKEKVMNLQNELDLKRITKNNKEKAMQESSSVRLTNEIENLENDINETLTMANDLKKQDQNLEKEITTLKRQSISNPKDVLSKTIAKVESDFKKSSENIRKTQTHINELEGEIESNTKDTEEIAEKINGLQQKIETNSKEMNNLNLNIARLNSQLQEAKMALDNKLHEIMRHKETASEVQENLEKCVNQMENLSREKNSLETKLKTLEKEKEQDHRLLEELERTHPYISTMENEIKDFDIAHARDKLEVLLVDSEKQSKRVNKKVSSTLDDHQKRYQSLTSKKSIVMNDKQRLHDIITDLDEKKQESITETWRKVNVFFGEIYNTLLPGTAAKLDPIDQFSGLEMKVAFNGDWKENLGELSGGQRSLLALSFILALLKCNPAPIYILDEVDAALDMSHTQNIGLMLKQQFSQSQFIVVSLKEGLFSNANVLFRTQFVDGKSVVTRHALSNNSADERARNTKRYR